MKSLKRLSRYTSILLSVLLMLTAVSPGITALAQEKATAAPTSLRYEDDSITAELQAADGTTLPAGAALSVKALDKDSQDEAEKALYAETEASLNAKAAEQGTEINGFTAYNVKLQDKDGKDVTPKTGSFTLKLTYKEANAPEAFLNSTSADKGVTLYQKTEGKDEQNNTVYTMEVTGTEEDTQITADDNGKVQAVESKLTTLQPIALTWQSVFQADDKTATTEINETSNVLSSESTEIGTNEAGMSEQGLKDNQVRFKFHVNNQPTWEERDQYFSNWIVNIVDKNGNEIKVQQPNETISLNLSSNNVAITDLVKHIQLEGGEEYQFVKSTVTGYTTYSGEDYDNYINEEKDFTTLVMWTKDNMPYQYQYKNGNSIFCRDRIDKDENNNIYTSKAKVTLVYTKVEPLTETPTVNSQQYGVNIQMFDYDKSIPNAGWGGYGSDDNEGRIKQNLLQRKLNENGIPVSAVSEGNYKIGQALTENFSVVNQQGDENPYYKGEANKLFRLDEFEKDQTFYYSSFENYAYWNGADPQSQNKEFTVYDQIGTPKNENNYFYKRGNFMPYNKIEAGKFSTNRNLFDENGKKLEEGSSRYNEALYKTQSATSGATPDEGGNNYQFGMVVSANFAQLENGKFKGNDMVYEFNGDDDMWVFVDGVLVLDIGGIHDAHSGSINFATGEVRWYDCKRGADEPQSFTTTIEQQFKTAGENTETDEWQTSKTPDSAENYNKIFSDYSNHDIKIFYMERGKGASNCKMKFNLPVMPKNSIKVAKTVGNINEGSYSDVEFKFKLYVESSEQNIPKGEKIEKDGKTYQLVKDENYQRLEGSKVETVKIENDGIFKLHHGQEALFQDIATNDKQYIVEEIGVDQNRYDEFTVNSQPLDKDENIIQSETDGICIVRTNPLSVGKNAYVNFVNYCKSDNSHSIEITKTMTEGQESTETFQVQVEIGGQLFNGKYSIRKKDNTPVVSDITCENGIINLKADEIITIPKIAADTSFIVKEINLDNNLFDKPQYTIQPDAYNAATIDDNGISGNISYGHNAQITITNTLKLGSLKITKNIVDSEVDYTNGDPIFTFKIEGPVPDKEGEEQLVLYRTLRLSKDVGKTASITVKDLPVGDYTVTELNTMRFSCQSTNPQTQTVQQNNTTATEETPPADFTFDNKLTNDDYFSHTDVVENSFKIDADGKVTVTQNIVPEGQTPDGKPAAE